MKQCYKNYKRQIIKSQWQISHITFICTSVQTKYHTYTDVLTNSYIICAVYIKGNVPEMLSHHPLCPIPGHKFIKHLR